MNTDKLHNDLFEINRTLERLVKVMETIADKLSVYRGGNNE